MCKKVFFFLFLSLTVNAQYILLGPMVGHVDEESAKIWSMLDQPGTLTVTISENKDLSKARAFTFENFERGSVSIDGLKPEKEYFYQLRSHKYSTSSICSFKTVPKKDKPVKFSFMFTSCSGHKGAHTDWSWDELSRKKNDLDLILLLGDNHYADTTEPDIIAKHYFMHRAIPGYTKTTSEVPTYGIWDDHDFGPNNSDGQSKGKEKSLAVFQEFWGNPSYGEKDNPGIYFTFQYGDVQFIMLDSRYHRTPNTSMKSTDSRKVLLGDKQFKWLERTLKKSKAKIKFVACGSEFQMFGSSDGFSGFRTEQKKVLDLFKSVDGVVLLSGDRHFTAGYQIRGETIEITSGPLGSRTVNDRRRNEDKFFIRSSGKMYSTFDVDTTGKEPKLKLKVYKTGGGIVKEIDFNWAQINGKEEISKEK